MIWGKTKGRHTLFKILSATGVEVRYVDDVTKEDLDGCRLVVLDYDSLRDDASVHLTKIEEAEIPPAVLILTASKEKADLISLLSHKVLTNLFAKNTDLKATELIVTVQKIITNDIFGIDKYLTWGVDVHEETIVSSAKEASVDRLQDYLRSIGINRRLAELARSVADEFLMNAIYSAPVDQAGIQKYADHDRTTPLTLGPGEELIFRYGCDGHYLAISVEDKFGRLQRDTVLYYLRKCFMKGDDQIDEKAGGAGLGLFQAFKSLNHLVINVASRRRTEMIGTMDVSGTYKDFAQQPKSLHLFFDQ